ncbi:quinoprotein relay system zinc metallohydrolase 2 [Rivibacter subsaxonicus]|uniref:Quinoprotein relay system zinc metallohydrolase 2 n=1 Tax=Rivibacter subsaxonicus TaxID=457575 RepID=A0A4Q7W095_9BURK|nr:quinoprotein relay system zinc metallohydrolase 2 [Rivibacter subsaxonicus]RZU02225.1 quinoprotein relay system zinc metallohydrolase 2 [Rivibacter subsaxonicus]
MRPWLRALALTVGWGALAASTAAAPALRIETQELAPGVHVHVGAIEDWGPDNAGDVANLGFVVGARCVAVIDSGGSRAVGEALRAAIARRTDKPVCAVVNTHAHPDHVLGNAAFLGAGAGGASPEFIGHARLPAALAARGPYYLKALERDFGAAGAGSEIVLPTRTVGDALNLDIGGRTLLIRAWPTAHTDADLTVTDVQSGTLFAGDLLFVEHLPALDGKLLGWLGVMDALAREPVRLVVPGHGAPSRDWPAALAPQRAYLLGLRDGVKDAIARNLTLSQTVNELDGRGLQGWRLTDRFHRRNLTAAFAELEWAE